jgi:hypothetical protein
MSLFWNLAGWALPYRIYNFLQDRRARQIEAESFERQFGHLQSLAATNSALRDRHAGARAFVLCNGPTTLEQNLLPLEGEIVFSVSSGYLHRDYDKIKPRYHCVPQITYGRMTEDDVVAWFREMHSRIGDAEIFLSATEEAVVRKHKLFCGRKVHYVFLNDHFDDVSRDCIPNMARALPHLQSVGVMGLLIALYMGLKDIYLLGTEHSDFRTGVYRYAFESTVLKGKDVTVSVSGQTVTSRYDDFHGLGRLWRQYRITGQIAKANGARIWNATAGGELDEFPRISLDAVFAEKPAKEADHSSLNNLRNN